MTMEYCDNCTDKHKTKNMVPIPELKFNVASANKGESAILCKRCYDEYKRDPSWIEPYPYQQKG